MCKSKLMMQRPDLVVFMYYVSSFAHAAKTISAYQNATDRYFHFCFAELNVNAQSMTIPFPEHLLCFFFAYSGNYRNYNKGILRSTMMNDITAFKRFHRNRNAELHIFEYVVLELLLDGFKNFQRFRSSSQRYSIKFDEIKQMILHLLEFKTYFNLVWAAGLQFA